MNAEIAIKADNARRLVLQGVIAESSSPFAYYARPAAVSEPEDTEARERAVAARFNAATPEERAKMISAAAAKGTRPPRSNK